MIFKTIDDETTLSGQRIVGALQARKIDQEQAIKQTNLDIQCLRNYETACKNGAITSDDFTRIMGKASTQAQEYSKNIKEGTGSAQIYTDKQKVLKQSIQNTGTVSKVAAVGVKALSIAGNMLAGMAISFAISKIIEGIEYLATASERAIEKTKELQQEISQISSDYESERNTLVGLKDEYDSLTSKIGENGAKASLSASEYERYRDITSEILGITPKLITGWDEEGRAISNKNNLLQMSIDLLDEEYQKSLRNSTTKSKNEEIAAGIIEQKKDFDNSGDTKTVSGTKYDLVRKDLKDYVDKAVAGKKINYTYKSTGIVGKDDADAAYAINEFVYGDSLYEATELNKAYGWLGSLQERITSSKENFEKFANSLSNEDNPIYQWFTDEQIDELIRDADEYFQELARIEGEEQQYFQQYKDQLNLNAQAVGDAYYGLDEQTKTGITQMIDSFDYSDMTKEKFSDMATDLKDFVRNLSTDNTLLSCFNNLFNPMGEDESIEDYETRVKTGIDEITSYCKSNYPAIKLSFGDVEGDVENLKEKYNTAISKFVGEANDVDLGQFFKDNSINEESEIDYWNKVTDGAKTASEAVEMYNKVKSETFDNKTDISFAQAWNAIGTTGTDEEKQKAQEIKEQLLELAEAGKLTTEAFENSSIAEDFLNDTKLSAEEATKKINTLVEETKQLASLKSGISSITSAYDEKKDSKTNTVSSSTLESMYDTLGVAEWDKTTQKAWQNYKKNASSSSKSMNDLKESQDKLATAYVNSNNFLSNLNKTNQDYYEGLLTEMGITNAHEITTNILNYRISDQIQKKLEAKSASIDFSNATHEEIDGLISYGGQLGLTEKQINSFILKQSLANNNPLSTSFSIENLKAIGEQLTLTGKQLTWYTKLMQAANTINAAKFTYVDDKTLKKSEKDVKKYTKKIQGYQNINLDIQSSSGDKSNDSGSNDSGNNLKKDNSSQTRSTETIDWIARRLEVLQSAIDLTKAKFENLFRFQAKKNNINAQIKQTTKLLQAQEKVADRYAKKAANVSLSSNLKKKVKKGQIDGKLSELLKNYDEDTANKISKYQEYWDKSQDSKKSVQELKKSRKELMDQKDQLHVDRAEQKISTLDAKAEISNTAKEKNRLENKKIEQLKESYQYQIKIAEREKNSVKVTELRARKEKEILEIKKQILQNTLDENEATRSYNDARYANAKTLAEKNAILDNDIESYRSDQQANETYYSQLVSNTQKKAKKSLGTNALMGSLASSQVAGKNKNKILDLIKKGNPIPDSILNRKNVKNHPDLLNKLIEYNNSLDDITKEVEKVQQDKDKADQETKTAIREKEIQKLQNNAEAAEANYNLSKIREDNAITAKEKNKQEENSRASLIEQYDYLKKIAETNGDIVEQQRLEEELQEKIAQSYQTEFHNIKAEYEKKTTLNEGNISSTQAEISALQAQGKAVSESFYGSLLNDTRYKKKLLIEEKNDLEDKLASLEVGSDAWYEAIETLDNLDVSIIKCDEDTAQFTKTINEQKLALLSLKTAQIQSGIDHVSFLIDELSHKDLTKKESGGFTTEGLTVLSLYASQMQQNKDKLASVRASYDEFQKQVALGISNLSEEEIQAKNDDYMKQIQDIISANSALKDSMISLVKEGFEVQLDSLNELIDTRKKALQSEKNLYDYQRKVADQTKTITNIEKQMAALSGDDSEETRAKLQKLAVELDTAKQDLKDTEYDQWISDQEELLDSLSEDFEDFMENMLRDTDALIEQVIEAINQNGDIVSSTLSSLGYGNASTVSTIDNGDGTHTTTITDYNGNTTSLTFDQKGNVISSSKEADKKSVVLDILNNYAERRGYARNPVEALFLNAGYNNYLSEEAIEKLSSISGKSWTSADDQNEANAVYNWLKEIGFANGGVVGGNSYSGDRLWARVNSGESILTRKFTDLLPETLHTMNRFINLPSCNLPSLPVTNAQPALQMGNIDIHLDGSSVTDPKSFVDVFKNSREMQTAVQNATIGQIARSYSNSLNI